MPFASSYLLALTLFLCFLFWQALTWRGRDAAYPFLRPMHQGLRSQLCGSITVVICLFSILGTPTSQGL